jgi:hypothetical protein
MAGEENRWYDAREERPVRMRVAGIPRVLLPLVAVVLILARPGSPALAQKVTGEDPSGDAKAAADILSVTYNNGSARLGASVDFRNLRGHGGVGVTIQKRKWSGRALLLRVTKHRHHRLHGGLYRERSDGSFYRLRCNLSGRWRAGKDRVHMWVPQRCVKKNKGTWLMWTYARGAGDLDFTHTSKVPFG